MPRKALSEDQIEVTQQRILAATARILLKEGGYHAFSMRRLAQHVGLTAGALYRYFPTRQHVLMAYWANNLRTLNEQMKETVTLGLGWREELIKMMDVYIDFALEDADRYRVLMLEDYSSDFKPAQHSPAILDGYGALKARLEQAIRLGNLRMIEPALATHLMWGAVHGVIALSMEIHDINFGDVRKLARQACENALRGLEQT